MAEHNDLGKYGEQAALRHLLQDGFLILEKNWRFAKDEVDIIAEKNNQLVFVEVKTRKNNFHGEPEEFVSKVKQKNLIRAANAYVDEKDIFKEIRFDIIAVTLQPELSIQHLPEAFYP